MSNQKPSFADEIQYLVDELKGLDVPENERFSRWAAANSRVIELGQEEATFKLILNKDEKEMLQYARQVAQEEGPRARAAKTLQGGVKTGNEPLTGVQQLEFNQIKRQIDNMKFEDDKPRVEGQPASMTSIARTAKAIKEFGAKRVGIRIGKSEIPYNHPAKNELWKLYYAKLATIYPPEFDKLVSKESLVEVEAIRLKKLVEKQMPGLITNGMNYGVDTNDILKDYQENEAHAVKLIEDFARTKSA